MKKSERESYSECLFTKQDVNTEQALCCHDLEGLAFRLSIKYQIVKSDNCYVYMNLGSDSEPYYIGISEKPCVELFRLFSEVSGVVLNEDDMGGLLELLQVYGNVNGPTIVPENHLEIPAEVL